MNKKNNSSRIIATFFLLIFFPTIFPLNLLYAGNNGPNAYDSTSFEPVDAMDMVNLVTGDMSYVLPLINVPSPEGGYPLALSYHSGIAMDQESSWVGLGWSLTPGAINRSINGYADDIESGKESNFLFHQGEINSYQIGIGSNIMGINIGLGAHWGSNKAFGGIVTLGYGPLSITSSSGGVGVMAGYNGHIETISSQSLGTSLKTMGGAGLTSKGVGLSRANTAVGGSVDDYNLKASYDGFDVNAYFFNLSYGHTRTRYTLFHKKQSGFMGSVYPLGELGDKSVYDLKGVNGTDSNNLLIYNSSFNIFHLLDAKKHALHKNTILPSLDHYNINAQGLNGSITPTFTEELPLYHSILQADNRINDLIFYGYNEEQPGIHSDFDYASSDPGDPTDVYNTHYFFVPTPFNNLDHDLRLNNKIFFEFEGENSSYLRIDRGNIERDISEETIAFNNQNPFHFEGDEIIALMSAKGEGAVYNENSVNGIPLKVGNRKRTGKFIESFTNSQILGGNSQTNGWFIHPQNLNRNDVSTYLPESIGGFRVTDLDGKVYHYSLPVINYETWYKNFNDRNDEYNGFLENTISTPYATDWLLTAVTGPDYLDVNSNGITDEGDYGYWVNFEYGKWTDGFIWQTSSGDYDIVNEGREAKQMYEYYRGRKQVYYLDAIKTRTHTAYFIKSLRDDSLGKELSIYSRKWDSGQFDTNWHAKNFVEDQNFSYGTGYNNYDWGVDVDSVVEQYCSDELVSFSGKKKVIKYYDFPKHFALKLDKIILVKNGKLNLDKRAGNNLSSDTYGLMLERNSFILSELILRNGTNAYYSDCIGGEIPRDENQLPNQIALHLSDNVLDSNDLVGINVNTYAEKIIDFNYNYSLMPSSPNSIAANQGKLTLKDVTFLGKKGISYLPPYKFNYKDSGVNFDVANEDAWGYNSRYPIAWNLSEITTPLGSKINVDYEQDDYNDVAAKVSRLFDKGLVFHIWKNDATNELYFSVTKSTDTNDNFYSDFKEVADCFSVGEKIGLDMFLCRRSKYNGHRREVNLDLSQVEGVVTSVSSSEIVFKMPNSDSYWELDHQNEGWILGRKISYAAVRHLDGSNDGVIIRHSDKKECHGWRPSYENDDFSIQYTLASSNIPKERRGGGIRVKSIAVFDNEVGNIVNKKNYYYNKPGYSKNPQDVNYKSSGITSYTPSKEEQIIPYISELPPAIVMYGNVSVEECGMNDQVLQRTDYTFETLVPYSYDGQSIYKLGKYFDVKEVQNEHLMGGRLNFNKYQIKSRINYLGRLLSVKSYNSNNDLILSTVNNYFSSNDSEGEIGVKQEAYLSKYWKYDPVYNGGERPTYNFVSSATKTWYPSKLESVSHFNSGYTNTKYYENYDFLTGQALDQKVYTSDNKLIKFSSTPAYKKYYGMGAKVDNIQNKNMLTQTTADYSLLYDDSNLTWGVTGVGMTRWNNSWSYKNIVGDTYTQPGNTWRKSQTFIYKGDRDENGVYSNYNLSNNQGFVWTGTSSPSLWLNTSTVTLYDNYSNPLEVKDINGNYTSQKMGDGETKVMATGNARYTEMYYAGAETIDNGYWLEPEVRLESGNRSSVYAHTGKYSVAATSSTQFGVYMRSGQHRSGAYKLSVWVHKNNAAKARVRSWNSSNVYEFNGESIQAGDWILKTHYFYDVTTADFYPFVNSIDGTAVYFDDLRIHPIASSMTSYVYNEWDELTYVIGVNNLAVKYEYDDAGRLIKTYAEVIDVPARFFVGGFKLNSANKYNNKLMSN